MTIVNVTLVGGGGVSREALSLMASCRPLPCATGKWRRVCCHVTGIVLPGQSLNLPFLFKSECAGVFTQQFQLRTRPVLMGGSAMFVTLRGVALQVDAYEKRRYELEVWIFSWLLSVLIL